MPIVTQGLLVRAASQLANNVVTKDKLNTNCFDGATLTGGGGNGAAIKLDNENIWAAIQTFSNNISFGGAALNVNSLAAGNILKYNGTHWVNVNPTSPSFFAPADPTARNSATYVMMGLGSTMTYTPTVSGNLKITIFYDENGSGADTGGSILKYGTGAAPANNAAVTGTSVTNSEYLGAFTNLAIKYRVSQVLQVTGLTLTTAYWFDIAVKQDGAINVKPANIRCCIEEY